MISTNLLPLLTDLLPASPAVLNIHYSSLRPYIYMAMLSPVRTRGQTAKSAATRSKALNRTARPQLLVKLKIPKKRILPEESPTVTDDAPTEAEEMLTEGGPSTVIGMSTLKIPHWRYMLIIDWQVHGKRP